MNTTQTQGLKKLEYGQNIWVDTVKDIFSVFDTLHFELFENTIKKIEVFVRANLYDFG